MKKRSLPLLLLLALLLVLALTVTACHDTEVPDSGTSSSDAGETTPSPSTTSGNEATGETTAETSPETTKELSPIVSAVFGGGPFVTGGPTVAKQAVDAGFNTIIIGLVHVHENGDLYLNDVPVVSKGKLRSQILSRTWNVFKKAETVERIELSIGGWGCTDFENIRTLIQKDGTGEDTILYRNFKVLIEATGADAIDFDDETCYDLEPMAEFGRMCVAMGCKVTLCPYMQMDFWVKLRNAIGKEHVDRIYVQCYAGGAGNLNSLSTWRRAFGMDVIAGYWCRHNGNEGGTFDAADIPTQLSRNKNYVTGCFYWLYDDMMKLDSPNSAADYVNAIAIGLKDKKFPN